MIRHAVIWKMKGFADGQGREDSIGRVKEALEGLPGQMDGLIRHLEVGVNILEGGENSDLVLIAGFDSMANLRAYLRHPAHLIVAELLSKVREGRMAVDFEIPSLFM